MDQELKQDKNMDQINIKISKELKSQIQPLFSSLGLTTSGAITLFLRQAVLTQSIPFAVSLKNRNFPTNISDNLEFSPKEFNKTFPIDTIQYDVNS